MSNIREIDREIFSYRKQMVKKYGSVHWERFCLEEERVKFDELLELSLKKETADKKET